MKRHVFGLPVVIDESLDPDIMRLNYTRTWKERWLSWPWRPWVKTVTYTFQVNAKGTRFKADGETLTVDLKLKTGTTGRGSRRNRVV